MSIDTRINRLIMGLSILVVIVILVVIMGAAFLMQKEPSPPQTGERSPIETLTYCGAQQGRLCIDSFNQNADGQMRVVFRTPNAFYPEFVLTVIHNNGEENLYSCERGEGSSASMVCTGRMQVPGEVMLFKVISKSWGTLFAEGQFSIIGIALAAPGDIPTATSEAQTESPVGLLTPTPGLVFPLETALPLGTPADPSYPNPSYPNPSYPNPAYP